MQVQRAAGWCKADAIGMKITLELSAEKVRILGVNGLPAVIGTAFGSLPDVKRLLRGRVFVPRAKAIRVVPRRMTFVSFYRDERLFFFILLINGKWGKVMYLTGAQIIAECLLEQKVDTVFGYPGGAVLNIYDALYQYSDKIHHILTAHEQGAAHAADGYARATGRTGVVIATSGPGATNLVTGIATAYMDSVPMVAITGNVATDLLGRDSFQEVDITGITMPVTKHNFIVKNIDDLADVIRKAFRIAGSGRPGPVLIDVPKDVTAQQCEYTACEPVPQEKAEDVCEAGLEEVCARLQKAKRPVIYAGGGVISSDATQELIAFAEKFDCPVCCSLMGLGGFPGSHPLYAGMIGMHGSYESGKAVGACDLLLVAGARFSDRVAGSRKNFGKQATIVQIDIDKAEINKNVEVQQYLVGDLKNVLQALTGRMEKHSHTAWLKTIAAWRDGHPAAHSPADGSPDYVHILRTLRSLTGENDILATDVGQHQMWTAQNYRFLQPRTLLTSGGLGTMGYGLGAAIGAQVAFPDRRVVLVTGDGSFHMNLNELVTLSSYNLPIVIVLMNNTVLGMVRQWQKLFYGSRFSQTDPHRKTDFAALAHAFGIEGMRITKDSEVDSVLRAALDKKAPVLVECCIPADENVLPMIPPGGTVDQMITAMD